MKITIHKAKDRGHADHGWLKANHSFSFASYHNPEKVHFGVLRVLNDDEIAPGMGFGRHPHDNMEIITIPLEGALEHQDSTGGGGIIKKGDVQIMSAGTGIYHSEKNASSSEWAKTLQIWLMPKLKNISPRYDQKSYLPEGRKNQWQEIVAPDNKDALWINQDAWFYLADMANGSTLNYKVKKENNGVYVFVLEGSLQIQDETIAKRDAAAISNANTFALQATSNTQVLVMDIPMQL